MAGNAPKTVQLALTAEGLKCAAFVFEGPETTDFAFNLRRGRVCVVRCVATAAPADYRALKTMLREGDFDRAVLVYCDEDAPCLSDEIESWPISRIDELARRLAGEARA